MNLIDLKDPAYVIIMLFTFGVTLYNWLTAGSRNNGTALAEVAENIEKLDRRISKIEGEMNHLPDKDSQHQLELHMVELLGDMKTMAESQKNTTRTVSRMEEFLLQQGKSK